MKRRHRESGESFIAADRSMIAGIEKHLTKSESITLNNEKYRVSDLVRVLESRVEAHAPVAVAKAAWLKAARVKEERLTETDALVHAMKMFFLARYGSEGDILADFGLAPKTKRTPTVAEKYAATTKAKATRTSKKRGAEPAAQASTNGSATAPAPVQNGHA